MHTTLNLKMIDAFSFNDIPFVAMWGNNRVLYLNESTKKSKSQKSESRPQEDICWKGIGPLSGQEQLSPRNCLLRHSQKVFLKHLQRAYLTGNTIHYSNIEFFCPYHKFENLAF